MLRYILTFILRILARRIIQRSHPYVIGVTGSVGKTTITKHITQYLSALYGTHSVHASQYYNGEYGLPLTILGEKTGGKNPFLWMRIFWRGWQKAKNPLPKYLVLEYGVDHPGEMEYLLSVVRPDFGVIGPITPNHLEQFGSLERYRSEKLLLLKQSASHGVIHDSLAEFLPEYETFGCDPHATYFAGHITEELDHVSGEVAVDGTRYPLSIKAFGAYQIQNVLPLYALARELKIPLTSIAEHEHLFIPELGRSFPLKGIGHSLIIDGSYNGGQESMSAGILSFVPFLSGHRVIFFLGDMRELGESSRQAHEDFARFILEKISPRHDAHFFLVGPLMREWVLPLIQEKYHTESFLSSKKAGESIRNLLTQDTKSTLILAKGSQNTIFLEEGIKCFLREKEDERFLCRQSEEWIEKKSTFFQSLEK